MTSARDALLALAFRHRIEAPDAEAGVDAVVALSGEALDPAAIHAALGACLRDGLIHDPVRLPAGALQCHWVLELTPAGVEAAQARSGTP